MYIAIDHSHPAARLASCHSDYYFNLAEELTTCFISNKETVRRDYVEIHGTM